MFPLTTHQILIAGWIMVVGFALLAAVPLGLAACLWLALVGLIIVPALALIPLGRVFAQRMP